MGKDPAFLFYPEKFIFGTMFMTDEEVGKYIRLLCVQHQCGGFIDKDDFNQIVANSKKLKNKFVETTDGFYNETLTDIMVKRQKKSSNLSANALIRWNKDKKKQCKSNAKAPNLQMPIINRDKDVIKDEDVIKDKTGTAEIPEDYIQLSSDFHNWQHKAHPNLLKDVNDKLIKDGAIEIEKLIKIDTYTLEEIKQALKFSINDKFWSSTLISLRTIRNKGKNGQTKFVNILASMEKSRDTATLARRNAQAMEKCLNE